MIIIIIPLSHVFANSSGWIDLGRAKVSLEVPKKWKTFEKVMGFPLLVTSPMKNGTRVTVSITPSDIKNFGFKDSDFSKNENNYKEDALRWLGTRHGEAKEFYPYKKEEWSKSTIAHVFGWRYDLGGIIFVEKSMYVLCKKQLFHIKAMYKEKWNKKDAPTINEMLKSFKCEPGANI